MESSVLSSHPGSLCTQKAGQFSNAKGKMGSASIIFRALFAPPQTPQCSDVQLSLTETRPWARVAVLRVAGTWRPRVNESSIIRPILPADDPSVGDTVGQSLVMGVGKQKAAAGVGGGVLPLLGNYGAKFSLGSARTRHLTTSIICLFQVPVAPNVYSTGKLARLTYWPSQNNKRHQQA